MVLLFDTHGEDNGPACTLDGLEFPPPEGIANRCNCLALIADMRVSQYGHSCNADSATDWASSGLSAEEASLAALSRLSANPSRASYRS